MNRKIFIFILVCCAAITRLHADSYNVVPSINPELESHTQHFEKKIYKIGENVYSAVGWNLANSIMIEGDSGIIIVDTGGSYSNSKEVLKEFRKITDKPIKAVIYTHFHIDHINGAAAFVSEEQVKSGDVDIYSHESLPNNVAHSGVLLGPIIGIRTAYTFGALLPKSDTEGMNAGIGAEMQWDPSRYIAPSKTFSKELKVKIAGVDLHMVHVPSEAPDEIMIFLPESEILLSGEVIQGPTLPNLHTIRGTKFRDLVSWYKSIDVLRSFEAENMVPSHGRPIYGATQVENVLRNTRDGIQYIHDQTIRHMNKGLTPDELVEAVKLPAKLANFKPYLREYYGTVSHTVRQIYNGYLGWFQGDPVELNPIDRLERAQRFVKLMGGRDKVLDEVERAYSAGEYQWAAELATYLIRVNKDDMLARKIKASAFRKLGYDSININWRNWYLTSASELEGTLDIEALESLGRDAFSSENLIRNLSLEAWLEGWKVRVDPKKSQNLHIFIGLAIEDSREAFTLENREGVLQLHESIIDIADATLTMKRDFLEEVMSGRATLMDGVESGRVSLEGELDKLQDFLWSFDSSNDLIYLTLK